MREAGRHEKADRMWRLLQDVQKPWLDCQGKRFQEQDLLGPLGAARLRVGAAQGPC